MPAQLIALTDGVHILVDKPILLLGRDSECDIQFESRKISRRHCCIAQVGDQLIVRDLGSTNGVRINGERVVEGYLKAGDELTVGNHRYLVRWDLQSPGLGQNNPDRIRQVAGARSVPEPELDDIDLESMDLPVPIGARVNVPKQIAAEPEQVSPALAQEPAPINPAPDVFDIAPDLMKLTPASDHDKPAISPRKPPN